MKLRFNRLILLFTLLLMNTASVFAQEEGFVTEINDTVYLEGFIANDKSLESSKTYVLQHNVKIDKGATLTIKPNTTVLFANNTTLVVEGGLNLVGSPNKLVHFASLDNTSQGTGILIRGDKGANVTIKYTRFSKLKTPINFEMDWYRAAVTIDDNIFEDMNTGESNILILSPYTTYQNTTTKKVQMSFSKNNFVNTWGGIYIENFEDNILDLRFNNNLLTNNVVYGLEMGVPSNTPVFGFFDGQNRRFLTQFSGNSIYGNYQINASNDTIIREIGIGIQGEGEKFAIPNNYFRSNDVKYVSSTFDHFYQNDQLPLLISSPILNKPSNLTHAHIYRVDLNGSMIMDYMVLPDFKGDNSEFTVYFNRAVTEMDVAHFQSVYYDTSNGFVQQVPLEITEGALSNNNMVYTFKVDNSSQLSNPLGYLVISGYHDDEGFETPDFTIGQMNAINQYNTLYQEGAVGSMFGAQQVINDRTGFLPDEEDIETLEALTELGDLSYLGAYTSLAKTWEIGVMGGASNYLGETAFRFLDRDQYRWSAGVFGQYNISRWFSLRVGVNFFRLAGEDISDSDLGRRKRLANFKNDIFEGAATVHFHVLQYGISKGEKFAPAIYAGISVFRNNPMARIFVGLDKEFGEPMFYKNSDGDEVWVPLREIGTEGQTAGGPDSEFSDREPPKQYSMWQVAFPMGVNLDYIINKRWVIGIEIGFRLTVTDYLDDISGFYYDRGNYHQLIADANPSVTGWAQTGVFKGKKEVLPNLITVDSDGNGILDPTGGDEQFHPAQLLANPSLVNGTLSGTANDAFSFPRGNKGVVNRDWYIFIGAKVSKLFGYNKYKKKKGKYQEEEIIDL